MDPLPHTRAQHGRWWSSALVGAATLAVPNTLNAIAVLWSSQGQLPENVREALLRLAGSILRFHLGVALAVGGLGAAAGLAAWAALRGHGRQVRWWHPAGAALAAGAALVARVMADQPGLFEGLFWRRGGLAAGVQRLVVEGSGPRVVDGLVTAALVLVAASVLARHWRRLATRSRLAVVLGLGLAAVVGAAATQGRPHASSHARRPNLLVLAGDGLRADRFSSSGNPHATTPRLDAVRARGAWFNDFLVPMASTIGSWTTYLTGRYAHDHGVRDIFPRPEVRRVHLPTLPRLLREQGYVTAVVSDYAGDHFTIMDYGFDVVDAPVSANLHLLAQRESLLGMPLALALLAGTPLKHAVDVARFLPNAADPRFLRERAERVLDQVAREDRPVALFVFFSVTHLPFAAPQPDATAFTDASLDGPSRYSFDLGDFRDLDRLGARIPPREVAQVRALYDGALRAFDREAGALIDRFDALGAPRVVAVMGDHGEHLYEGQAGTGHGLDFLQLNTNFGTVLLLEGPGIPPGDRGTPALGTDVLPTLLARLDVPAPPGLPGVDLLRPVPEDRQRFLETTTWMAGDMGRPTGTIPYPPLADLLEPDPITTSLYVRREWVDTVVEARQRAVVEGRWLLEVTPTVEGRRVRLLNRYDDPDLTRDLGATRPELTQRLLTALDTWSAQDPIRWLDQRGHLVLRRER